MAALKLIRPDSPSSEGSPSELRATLAEHLEELRIRITRVLGVTIVATVVCWFFTKPVYEIFKALALKSLPRGVQLEFTFIGLTTSFLFTLQLAFSMALGVAIPYIVTQLWGFVAPGLKPQEKKPLKVVAPISIALFFLGAFLAWVIMPVTFQWFFAFVLGYEDTKMIVEPSEVIFFPVSIMLAFGAGFQMPIVVYFLAWLDIISPKMLLRYWRHGIVAVMVASAVITPSGDIPTMLMMAVPLTVLYFATLLAAQFNKKSRQDVVLDNLD